MGIVISSGVQSGSGLPASFEQGASFIAYDSFFLRSDASVTVDSEDTGQEIDNGTSWFTYGGGWQTSNFGTHEINVSFLATQTGQCFALHKHNLFDLGCTVKLQSSQDAVTYDDVAGSEQTPPDNSTFFFVADDEVTAPFWRIVITGHLTGTLRIAQIFIGPAFQVFQSPQVGWIPPNLALNDTFINSRSDGGDFLGRSFVRRGSKTSFKIGPIPESWVRSFWLPFMRAAEEHPFYYSWDNVNSGEEVAYCYTEGKIDRPEYTSHRHFRVALRFIALQL